MLELVEFGRTGHRSTRVLFGAAALGTMRQDRADAVLDTLLEFGVNHIDTAASYGESELRMPPGWPVTPTASSWRRKQVNGPGAALGRVSSGASLASASIRST